jgi:hypothetical protein
MTYRGKVKNGVVVLEGPQAPPEGSAVSVRVLKGRRAAASKPKRLSLYDRLQPVVGIASGLPHDLAKNHDHYLHGRPKK